MIPTDTRSSETWAAGAGDAAPANEALRDLRKALDATLSKPSGGADGTERGAREVAGNAAGSAPAAMPKFLNDEDATATSRAGSGAASLLSAIASLCALALVGAWTLANAGGTFPSREASQLRSDTPAQIETSRRSRLDFVGTDSCVGRPCGALLTFQAPPAGSPATQAARPATTGEAARAPTQSAAAESGFDPLGTVIVKGLPPESRLSVGNKVSDTEWALTVGDLNGLGLIVPDSYKKPIRATFQIRSRDGRELAVFDLNIARDGKAPQKYETAAGPPDAIPPPHRRPPVPGSTGEVPIKGDKSSLAQKKNATLPKPTFSLQGAPAKPAIPVAGSQSDDADEKPGATLFGWPSSSSPKGEDDPPAAKKEPAPGFETLINLGGGYFAFDPSQP